MSSKKNQESSSHAVSPAKIVIIGAIVLVGVAVGSLLGLKKANKDYITRYDKPTRMGHVAPRPATTVDTNEMTWIPAGSFWMGSEEGQSDEKPTHKVTLDGFWIDKHE